MNRNVLPAVVLAVLVLAGCVPIGVVQAPSRRLVRIEPVRTPDLQRLRRDGVLQLTVHIEAGKNAGTGIRVGPNTILTCRHVIGKYRSVQVQWQGQDWPQPAYHGFLSEEEDLALLVLDSGGPRFWEDLPIADELKENEFALVCGYPLNRFSLMGRKVLTEKTLAGLVEPGTSGSGSWVRRGNRYVLAGVVFASTPPIANPKTYMLSAAEVSAFIKRVKRETEEQGPAEAEEPDATYRVIIRER